MASENWLCMARRLSERVQAVFVYRSDGEGFKDSMPIHLTEGRMPESNSEIILPKHVETNGGVKFKIGDILSLEIGDRISDGLSLTRTIPICMRKTVVKQRIGS